MAFNDGFRFVADVTAVDGRYLGQLPLDMDWESAVQAAYWVAVRRGVLPPLMRCASATIEPSWHSERGAPRVDGVRITCHGADGARASATIPRLYFRDAVETAALQLVAQGVLAAGERFYFEVCAYPVPDRARYDERAGDVRLSGAEIPQPLPLVADSLETWLRGASRCGDAAGSGEDMPVFIPEQVIAEAKQLARQAGDVEWGGVLIGRLYRDTATPEIFCQVTALIPARHTVAARTRLTFTAQTWAAARAALDLRAKGELVVGFVHNHPFWCRDCPAENRRHCPLIQQPFFSRDDVALTRAMFPRPFNIAVLLSDLGEADRRCDVFGWRGGMVAARGYHLIGGVPQSADDSATDNGAATAVDTAAAVANPAAESNRPRRDGSPDASCANRPAEHRTSADLQAP